MIYTAYYLIRPKPEFHKTVNAFSEDLDALFPANVISQQQGGRTALARADFADRAKILFIANLFDEYSANDELRPLFQQLFPDERLDAAAFDAWWTIEEIEEYATCDQLACELSPAGLARLVKSAPKHAAHWVKSMIDEEKNRVYL